MGGPANPPDHPAVQFQTLTGNDQEDNDNALKFCMAGFDLVDNATIQPTVATPARLVWIIGYKK